MPRSEARVSFGIWVGLDEVGPHARLAYFALLTEPTVNQAGVGALRESMWVKNTRLSFEELREALDTLQASRHLVIDEVTEEVLIRSFIRGDGVYKSPNVLKSALKSATAVQSAKIRAVLAVELRKLDSDVALVVADELEGVVRSGKPLARNSSATPSEQSENRSATRPPERCEQHLGKTKSARPCRACGAARKAAEAWDATHARAGADANAASARARAAARVEAAKDCDLCDELGARKDRIGVCDHKPAADRRAPVSP